MDFSQYIGQQLDENKASHFMIVSNYTYYEISVNTEVVHVGNGKKEQWSGAELSA